MLPENVYEARRLLLRRWPMYGMAVMGAGDPVFDLTIPTACTDGLRIRLNPAFVHRMPVPHLAFVLAHEGIHILRADPDHMARRVWPDGTPIAKKNLRKLNQACDQWINLNAKAEGFEFPPIPLCCDPRYKGMTVRQIYDLLPDPPDEPEDGQGGEGEGEGEGDDNKEGEGTGKGKPKGKSKSGSGSGKPGEDQAEGDISTGHDVAPRPLTPEETVEHRIKVRQAYEAARSQGNVPGWAEQFVDRLTKPRITFKDFFEPWLHDTLDKDDASYRRLNRHYLPDWFAPTILGNNYGNFVVALDTSGSCWHLSAKLLSIFNTALTQLRPVTTTLVQFDTQVQPDPQVFLPGQTVESGPKVRITGGGGTTFVPIFEWIRRLRHDQIDGLIVLTDMWGDFPHVRPTYPVLWVSVSDVTSAPFGRVFRLQDKEAQE